MNNKTFVKKGSPLQVAIEKVVLMDTEPLGDEKDVIRFNLKNGQRIEVSIVGDSSIRIRSLYSLTITPDVSNIITVSATLPGEL